MELWEKRNKRTLTCFFSCMKDLYEDPTGEQEPEEGERLTEMDKSVRSMLLLMLGL